VMSGNFQDGYKPVRCCFDSVTSSGTLAPFRASSFTGVENLAMHCHSMSKFGT
jgi:hypothetical protein